MDKTNLLSRAASPEERMLLARVLDKYEQMDRRNIPTATPFLTPAEQAAVQALLNAAGIRSGYVWNGGYPQAERKLLQFLPDWCEEDNSVLTSPPSGPGAGGTRSPPTGTFWAALWPWASPGRSSGICW